MKATTIARVQMGAWLPALLTTSLADGTATERDVLPSCIEHGSAPEDFQPAEFAEVTADPIRSYSEPASEWTAAMTKRFRELVRKEALENLSPAEAVELERLTRDRRNLQHPRTVEEVLWETRQREVTARLIEALREYVEFHQAPHPARPSTR